MAIEPDGPAGSGASRRSTPSSRSTPSTPSSSTADWWRHAVVYQIYPRSFADSNGDGIGDLPGITKRLSSLADLGVNAVWISPFYRSPQADAGYDVADYRDIDVLFGTLADCDELLARAHQLGLKVIVDLVPNHSSDQHVWFRQALASAPGSAARDRYMFRDGAGPDGNEPPNNWESVFGGPAWTRVTHPDGSGGQWYLHLFDVSQPDFNWENPEVRAEFEAVLHFWLDRGVDGFRVDVAHGLIKQPGLPDFTPDPTTNAMGMHVPEIADAAGVGSEVDTGAGFALTGASVSVSVDQAPPSMLGPMWDQEGVHEIYRSWRKVVDGYLPPRMLVAEAWVQPLTRLARYVRPDEMQQAFNFDYLEAPWNVAVLRQVINRSLAVNATVGATTTWVLSNHDVVRHTSRFGLPVGTPRPNGISANDPQPDAALGLRRGRAATLTMLALPGSAYLYQGEELGLPEHTTLDDRLRQDPTWGRSGHTEPGRDGCRVPLPWESDAPGLGFSPTGGTWLPQPDSFTALARDRQVGEPASTLTMYRTALRLRRDHGLGAGSLEWSPDRADGILRFSNGEVTVLANMSGAPTPLPRGEVLLASVALPGDGTLPPDVTVWMAAE